MAETMDEHRANGLVAPIESAVRAARARLVPSGSSEPGWSAHGAVLSRTIWLLWVIWLAFLFYPIQALFQAHPSPVRTVIALTAAALFAALYTWNVIRALNRLRTGDERYSPWPALILMAALAVGLTVGDRGDWVELFIFMAVSMGPSLPTRQALLGIGIFVLLTPVLGVIVGASVVMVAQMMFQMAVSGIATVLVTQTIILSRQLREARGEIGRLAVNEERLRFARDLHDLLGHSLSLIALKSELAARLATTAPERAAAEMRDVESAARISLHEVREAVAGYRQPALAGELRNAGELLSAAGIAFDLRGGVEGLPVSREAALAWAVREGVTNIIKHSRARHCTISLSSGDGSTALEVWDDGVSASESGAGSGLAGLKERLTNLGGWCEAGPLPEGGFRLAVGLPLEDARSA